MGKWRRWNYAHEISHVNGLNVGIEEYDSSNNLPTYGYNVKARQYRNNTFSHMGSNRPDNDVWIRKEAYKFLITAFSGSNTKDPEVINISGTINKNSNETNIQPFYKFYSEKIDVDSLIINGRNCIKLKNSTNQILRQYGFTANFKKNHVSAPSIITPFNLNVPTVTNTKKIEICDSLGNILTQRIISDNSPTIDLQYPAAGQINTTDSVYIGWNSNDTDGDTLYHAIFYSVQNNENGPIWIPVDIDVKGDHYNWRSLFIPNLNYRVKIYATDGYNTAVDSSDGNFIIGTPSNITVAPQGFMNISSNILNMKDTASIYLRNNFAPYTIIDSGKTVLDSLTFTGNLFFNHASTGTYYVVVKHRNCIETWSKAGGQLYTTGIAFDYNYTSAATQAYGNNLKLVGTKYCIYSGDENQDGIIDVSDLINIYNNALNFTSGYVAADIDGNNFVDVSDLIITYNNSNNIVEVITP